MRTRTVVVAAVAAALLGVVASLALDRGGFLKSRLGQALGADAPPVPRGVTVANVGDPVPSLELPDPAGRRHRLPDVLGGRPAVVNLWASWCRPCLEEMPALDAFARAQGATGVQVVGIALDDAGAVRAFLARRPVGYPILVDAAGPADAGVRLGNTRGVLPYSVLVGADGQLLQRHVGPLGAADLEDWASAALRTRD